MQEGEPVLVEPPEGHNANNDTVWLVQRALNGPRDVSRAGTRTRLHIPGIRSSVNILREPWTHRVHPHAR